MKRIKKLIAIALALALLISLIPFIPDATASADGSLSIAMTYGDGTPSGQETDNKYSYPRSDMITKLYIESNGTGEKLTNVNVVVSVPKEFMDLFNVPEFTSSSPHTISKREEDGDNYKITIHFDEYDATEKLGFPISLSFSDEITPINYQANVTATIDWDENISDPISTEPISFVAIYKDYGFKKYVTSNKSEAYAKDGAMAVISNYKTDGEKYWVDDTTDIPFAFKINDKIGNIWSVQDYRDLSSVIITDTLPTYEDINGEQKTALFDRDKNPGWTLSEDGKTVSKTYTGQNSQEVLEAMHMYL